MLSAETFVQNVHSEMLAEKALEKTILKNDRTEMLPENLSAKLSSEISVPKCRPKIDL